jgi:uncharacterized protein (DUF488 family)
MQQTLYTIGHSTQSQEKILALLKQHGIMALCDVRSKPYSRTNPQFNREDLKQALRKRGIAYVFLGKELGARSDDPCCYENGRVQYDRLAQTDLFKQGIERVLEGMKKYRIALMCAEKEPLDCHRTILVARHLASPELEIQHILSDGRLESHAAALSRLMRQLGIRDDMFRSREELCAEAYKKQEERIAYSPPVVLPEETVRSAAG